MRRGHTRARATDTRDMKRVSLALFGIMSLAVVSGGTGQAMAGEFPKVFHCPSCGPGAGGSPYGNSGCGRRFWGAVHEEGWCPDPCDHCARWRGCPGAMPGLDTLAPWQLPPGRGFVSPEHMGYDTRRSCHTCEYQFKVR